MRRAAAGLIAATAFAVALPPAHASIAKAGKFAYVTTTTDVSTGDQLTPAGPCPSGYTPVSAGGSLTGAPSQGARLVEFKADVVNEGWSVGVRNDTGSVQRQTTVDICMKTPNPAPGYVAHTPSGVSSDHEFNEPCSASTLIGGGGGVDQPYTTSFLFSNAPHRLTLQEWRMYGYADLPSSWTYAAVCEQNGVLSVSRVRKQVVFDPRQTKNVSVLCPSSKHVSAGGWDAGFASTSASFSRPIDGPDADHVPDDGWRVVAHNDGQPDDASVVLGVYAICVQ